jgi:hypothetical protein
MLETPKALSTHLIYKLGSKNLKDVTMNNQQETKKIIIYFK